MSTSPSRIQNTNPDEDTDWFTPLGSTVFNIADPHPIFPAGALTISPADVLEVLGPRADELLATANVDVDELIRLVNAETAIFPPLVFPEYDDTLEQRILPKEIQAYRKAFYAFFQRDLTVQRAERRLSIMSTLLPSGLDEDWLKTEIAVIYHLPSPKARRKHMRSILLNLHALLYDCWRSHLTKKHRMRRVGDFNIIPFAASEKADSEIHAENYDNALARLTSKEFKDFLAGQPTNLQGNDGVRQNVVAAPTNRPPRRILH